MNPCPHSALLRTPSWLCLALLCSLIWASAATAETLSVAQIHYNNSQFAKARAACEAIIKDPKASAQDRRKAQVLRGLCFEEQELYSEALSCYRVLIESAPASAESKQAQWRSQQLAGHVTDKFRRLKAQRQVYALIDKAEYTKARDTILALKLETRPGQASSTDQDLLMALADCHQQLGDYERAVRSYKLALDSGVPDAEEALEYSERYIWRRSLSQLCMAVLALQLLLLLALTPWRRVSFKDLGVWAKLGAVWLGLSLIFAAVNWQLELFESLPKSIPLGQLSLILGLYTLPLTAIVVFAMAVPIKRLWLRHLVVSVYALALTLSLLVLACYHCDWLMILGL